VRRGYNALSATIFQFRLGVDAGLIRSEQAVALMLVGIGALGPGEGRHSASKHAIAMARRTIALCAVAQRAIRRETPPAVPVQPS